jgi:RNA polymerase sigma-70 factor (ECF subfamily)
MPVTMSDSPASTRRQTATVRLPAVADVDAGIDGEAELVAKAAAGDPAAFDALVTIHQEPIARLVHRLLGWPSAVNTADVDDVVQDTFVDVLRNLRRFDGRSSFATWLTRIAINRCRSHQRKQWVRRTFLRRLRSETDSPPITNERNTAESQETTSQVHAAIRELKLRDREIIVLRYLEERTPEEIATVLGINRGAVDVRLLRAKERLEKILKPLLES